MSKQFAPPPLLYLTPPNNINKQVASSNLDTKISPSILLIIIILAIIFFISGLLHLLVRCLLRSTQRDPDDISNDVTALQGQLRQLFHLHDSGVDQSYIDTLPVFHYKAIIGVKDPFDCAVCLCEFEPDDKLRLLPKCSHAFHMECIDTWLLSHSTCPLCRYCLINDFSSGHVYPNPIPLVCVLESGGESESTSMEIRESGSNPDSRRTQVEFESGQVESAQVESGQEDEKVVMVKLGKFGSNEEKKNENGNEGSVSRRCYSMGSFAYVMDEESSLQVQVKKLMKEKSNNNKRVGINRGAVSEYGGNDSRREFNGIENENGNGKRESFSVSKIWQRGMEKEREWKRNDHGSKREFFNGLESFQNENDNENNKKDSFSISKTWQRGFGVEGIEDRERKGNECGSKRTIFEIEIEDGEIEKGDEETQSNYSVDSIANSTSNHKRTLLWLMGRHKKVVHNHSSSSSSIV